MKNILTISKCLPYIAGPAVFAFEEAKALIRAGHRVHFLTYARYPSGTLSNFNQQLLQNSGIEFHFVKEPQTTKTASPLIDVALLSKALEIGKCERIDFVNAHYAMPHGLIAIQLGQKLTIPTVVTVQGSDINTLPHLPEFGETSRLIFENAGLLVAVSDSLKQGILKFMGPGFPKDVVVLGTKVDVSKFMFAKPDTSLQKLKSPKLLFVGRLAKNEKRVDLLLNAFTKVKERIPQAKLVVVGVNSGNYEIQSELKKLDSQEGIILVEGEFERIPAIYKSADIFVLCSNNEGFPNSICEAAASGLPIVTTPVGSIPAILKEGKNCLYARINDAQDLARTAIELLNDAPLRKKMAENNKKLAQQEFNIDHRCDQLLKLVDKIPN